MDFSDGGVGLEFSDTNDVMLDTKPTILAASNAHNSNNSSSRGGGHVGTTRVVGNAGGGDGDAQEDVLLIDGDDDDDDDNNNNTNTGHQHNASTAMMGSWQAHIQQPHHWSAHHHQHTIPPPMPSYYGAPVVHHHHTAAYPPTMQQPTYPPAPAPPPPPMPPGPAALRRRAAHRKATHRPSARTHNWGQAGSQYHTTALRTSSGVVMPSGGGHHAMPSGTGQAPLLHSSSAPVLGSDAGGVDGHGGTGHGAVGSGVATSSSHDHHHPSVRPWEVALPDAHRVDDGDDELQESESDVPGVVRGGGRARRAKQQWASGRSGILALEKELRELDTTVRSTLHNPASELAALSSHSVANHVCGVVVMVMWMWMLLCN